MCIIPLNSYKTSHGYAHKEKRVASRHPVVPLRKMDEIRMYLGELSARPCSFHVDRKICLRLSPEFVPHCCFVLPRTGSIHVFIDV